MPVTNADQGSQRQPGWDRLDLLAEATLPEGWAGDTWAGDGWGDGGWELRLCPLGPLRLFSGRLCVADAGGSVPTCPEAPKGEAHASLILLQPRRRPREARVAAVLLEIAPGRPARWEQAQAVEVGEVILLCDGDTRWRIDELASEGAWPDGFFAEVVEPILVGPEGLRLWAKTALPDPSGEGRRDLYLIQSGNAPGEYRLHRGRDALGDPVCLMLDLGVLDLSEG